MSVSQIQNGEDILNLVNNHKGQTIQLSNEEVYEQIKNYYTENKYLFNSKDDINLEQLQNIESVYVNKTVRLPLNKNQSITEQISNNMAKKTVRELEDLYNIIERNGKKIQYGKNVLDYHKFLIETYLLEIPMSYLKILLDQVKSTKQITEKMDISKIIKLYETFSLWVYLLQKNPLIHIYKFVFIIIINLYIKRLGSDDIKWPINEKCMNSFSELINNIPLINGKLISVIDFIKSNLSHVTIWFQTENEYYDLLNLVTMNTQRINGKDVNYFDIFDDLSVNDKLSSLKYLNCLDIKENEKINSDIESELEYAERPNSELLLRCLKKRAHKFMSANYDIINYNEFIKLKKIYDLFEQINDKIKKINDELEQIESNTNDKSIARVTVLNTQKKQLQQNAGTILENNKNTYVNDFTNKRLKYNQQLLIPNLKQTQNNFEKTELIVAIVLQFIYVGKVHTFNFYKLEQPKGQKVYLATLPFNSIDLKYVHTYDLFKDLFKTKDKGDKIYKSSFINRFEGILPPEPETVKDPLHKTIRKNLHDSIAKFLKIDSALYKKDESDAYENIKSYMKDKYKINIFPYEKGETKKKREKESSSKRESKRESKKESTESFNFGKDSYCLYIDYPYNFFKQEATIDNPKDFLLKVPDNQINHVNIVSDFIKYIELNDPLYLHTGLSSPYITYGFISENEYKPVKYEEDDDTLNEITNVETKHKYQDLLINEENTTKIINYIDKLIKNEVTVNMFNLNKVIYHLSYLYYINPVIKVKVTELINKINTKIYYSIDQINKMFNTDNFDNLVTEEEKINYKIQLNYKIILLSVSAFVNIILINNSKINEADRREFKTQILQNINYISDIYNYTLNNLQTDNNVKTKQFTPTLTNETCILSNSDIIINLYKPDNIDLKRKLETQQKIKNIYEYISTYEEVPIYQSTLTYYTQSCKININKITFNPKTDLNIQIIHDIFYTYYLNYEGEKDLITSSSKIIYSQNNKPKYNGELVTFVDFLKTEDIDAFENGLDISNIYTAYYNPQNYNLYIDTNRFFVLKEEEIKRREYGQILSPQQINNTELTYVEYILPFYDFTAETSKARFIEKIKVNDIEYVNNKDLDTYITAKYDSAYVNITLCLPSFIENYAIIHNYSWEMLPIKKVYVVNVDEVNKNEDKLNTFLQKIKPSIAKADKQKKINYIASLINTQAISRDGQILALLQGFTKETTVKTFQGTLRKQFNKGTLNYNIFIECYADVDQEHVKRDYKIIKRKNNKDEVLMSIREILNNPQIKNIYAELLKFNNIDDILIWSYDNKISSIDLFNYDVEILYTHTDSIEIKINGYNLLNTNFWMLQRWASRIPNLFVLSDVNNNLFLGQINNSKLMNMKINKMNYLPETDKKQDLQSLIEIYLNYKSIDNLAELNKNIKLIIDSDKYQLLPQNIKSNNISKKFVVDGYTITYNRIDELRYDISTNKELDSQYWEELYKLYYSNENKNILNLREFYLYILCETQINLNIIINSVQKSFRLCDYAFNLYLNKLINKYKNDPNPELREEVPRLESLLITNFIEFYYQYNLGYIARETQIDYINKIFDNISDHKLKTQAGGNNYLRNVITYNKDIVQKHDNKSEVHNLIMGGGKTSMITPIVVLRLIQILAAKPVSKSEHVYIVLPETLVPQSYRNLFLLLSLNYPINVFMLEENRNEKYDYTQSLKVINNDTTNVYVLSDTTIKCGFLNDYNIVRSNAQNNYYLFDEADTILNPLVSELNYPISHQQLLLHLDDYFVPLYKCLRQLYIDSERTEIINKMLSEHPDSWTLYPHFNIIKNDTILMGKLKQYFINEFVKYYSLTSEQELIKLNPNIVYTIYNFLNETFNSLFGMVNLQHFGIGDSSKDIIVPYVYNDVPNVKSQFTNPLLTLSLTIISYIVKTPEITHERKNIMMKIIIDLYDKLVMVDKSLLPKTKLFTEYAKSNLEIQIEDFIATKMISNNDIIKLFNNEFFLEHYLKIICLKNIKINTDQLNIGGVDLVLSDNIKNKSGFTGTPSIPIFHEIDESKTMRILPEEAESVRMLQTSIQQAKIMILPDNPIKTYLTNIFTTLSDDLKLITKTLIDVGGVLNGITPMNVYNEATRVLVINKFIYWNMKHEPMCIENGINMSWDLSEHPNNFYYYDNQHITGIDAKIPLGTYGLCLLGKNSKRRDVSQGMFRMRKLAKSVNQTERHSIIFVLSEKINKLIPKTSQELTLDDLSKWFDQQESDTINSQSNLMKLQNLRAIGRQIKIDKLKEPINFELYKIVNSFKYPELDELRKSFDDKTIEKIIKSELTYVELELMILEKVFSSQMELFAKLKPTIFGNSTSTTEAQEQQQQQEQEQEQEQQQQQQLIQVKESTFKFNYIGEVIEFDNAESYIDKSNYVRYPTYFKDLNIFVKYEVKYTNFYGLIFDMTDIKINNVYVVPLLDALTLVSHLKTSSNSSFQNVLIYDHNGLCIHNVQKEQISCSIVSRLFKKIFTPSFFISFDDYLNMIYDIHNGKYYNVLMEFNKQIHSTQLNDLFIKFCDLYNKLIQETNIPRYHQLIDKFNKENMDGVCENIILEFLRKQKADPSNSDIKLDVLQSIIVFFTGNIVCYQIQPKAYNKQTLQGGFYNVYKEKYLKYKQKYILLKHISNN
jgi:hypothetical protein